MHTLAAPPTSPAHNSRHLALLDAGLKRGQVRVDEVLLGYGGVIVIAVCAVRGLELVGDKVLAASGGLQREGRFLCVLQPLRKLGCVGSADEGVFPSTLQNSAPPWITDDVDYLAGG